MDWQSELPFGKYKGEMVGVVFEEDPGYIFWMINNTDAVFKPHVVEEANKWAKENGKWRG